MWYCRECPSHQPCPAEADSLCYSFFTSSWLPQIQVQPVFHGRTFLHCMVMVFLLSLIALMALTVSFHAPEINVTISPTSKSTKTSSSHGIPGWPSLLLSEELVWSPDQQSPWHRGCCVPHTMYHRSWPCWSVHNPGTFFLSAFFSTPFFSSTTGSIGTDTSKDLVLKVSVFNCFLNVDLDFVLITWVGMDYIPMCFWHTITLAFELKNKA